MHDHDFRLGLGEAAQQFGHVRAYYKRDDAHSVKKDSPNLSDRVRNLANSHSESFRVRLGSDWYRF
jgi:hypothetical protein